MARSPQSSARPDDIDPSGPVRTCIGCRRRTAKRELLRVTAGSGDDGRPAVVPDPTATAPGRGAHLHPTQECYDLAVRRKAFGRALRISGTPGLPSTPVAEHIARTHVRPDDTTRNWSSSS
ncbi:YlxR family protein [Nocardioides sp. Arc9.136]|uniref:YlxR family protein n=1 Tax=Nocardioides sp. Arc9.136 TaxID=2996826 RepID=UPI0026651C31|nr:YlxR family protein [Nocardioides sp. Arc9.136]WKN49968.1 YlxR family protein [Nocardioides sp. Arc9.136]